MNEDFYIPEYGKIELYPGWPAQSRKYLLPHSSTFYTIRNFGSILFQEVHVERFLLRYFIFQLIEQISIFFKEKEEALQSVVVLKGGLQHETNDGETLNIGEGQFSLLKMAGNQQQMIIPAARECQVLNTYYPDGSYPELITLFPGLKQNQVNPKDNTAHFISSPRTLRHSALDAINEILHEPFSPGLLKTYWELKLKQALFTQLAQTFTEEPVRQNNQVENEIAFKTRSIITEDIKKHFSIQELAGMVGTSESTLKRVFRQEFGMGIYEYLFTLRMKKAKQLLLEGEQVKFAARAIGMRPSNFTIQFQKFFGYKATSLKKSK